MIHLTEFHDAGFLDCAREAGLDISSSTDALGDTFVAVACVECPIAGKHYWSVGDSFGPSGPSDTFFEGIMRRASVVAQLYGCQHWKRFVAEYLKQDLKRITEQGHLGGV